MSRGPFPGRTTIRAATVLLLLSFVVPVVGEDDTAQVDGIVGVGGGRMSLLGPGCWYRTVPQPATFKSVHGQVRVQSAAFGNSQYRAEVEVGGELRFADSDRRTGPVRTGLARATVGWSSRYYGVRIGGVGGNVYINERMWGTVAGSLRLGLPHRHLRLAVLDQPGCLPANCLFGAEVLWTVDGIALLIGGSGGFVGGRGYLQLPFRVGDGLLVRPGIDIGADSNSDMTFSLTVALGLSSG